MSLSGLGGNEISVSAFSLLTVFGIAVVVVVVVCGIVVVVVVVVVCGIAVVVLLLFLGLLLLLLLLLLFCLGFCVVLFISSKNSFFLSVECKEQADPPEFWKCFRWLSG